MKRLLCLCLALLLAVGLLACGENADSSIVSYTYSVDNGDKIKLTLDTTGGYAMASELPFSIMCDSEILTQGTFIEGSAYDDYVSAVEGDEDAQILDQGTKDGNDYLFWCYGGSEYNYAVRVAGSQTGLLLGNVVSQASAEECFQRLTISAQ